MREAFARAGLWFFGTIIGTFILGGDYFKDASVKEAVLTVVSVAFVVAGAIFFYTWHGHEREDRELGLNERRRALKKSEDAQ